MEDYLQVGAITSTHGIKGEMKVFPTTDDPTRFEDLDEVFIEMGREMKPLHVQNVKYFKQFVILKFKEYSDINDIEQFKGKGIFVDREHAVELEDDEYFVADLIGLKVVTDDGLEFGELVDVMFTGANDVYIVKRNDNGEEALLPAIEECILEIDLDSQIMKVHIMEGLLD